MSVRVHCRIIVDSVSFEFPLNWWCGNTASCTHKSHISIGGNDCSISRLKQSCWKRDKRVRQDTHYRSRTNPYIHRHDAIQWDAARISIAVRYYRIWTGWTACSHSYTSTRSYHTYYCIHAHNHRFVPNIHFGLEDQTGLFCHPVIHNCHLLPHLNWSFFSKLTSWPVTSVVGPSQVALNDIFATEYVLSQSTIQASRQSQIRGFPVRSKSLWQ